MSVHDVTDSSAKLIFNFTQPLIFSAQQDIVCEDGNIKADSYLDLAGDIGRLMSGMKMTTTTRSVSGTLMPADPKVGDSWTTEYAFDTELEGIPESAGLSGMSSTVKTVNRVLAEEAVSVPAGEFTALKIEESSTATTTLGNGKAMPSSTTVQIQWWVKDIGMVKTTTETPSGTMVSEAVNVLK